MFTINAPDSVFVDMSVFAKSHLRRSSTLSLTAFACPIVFPTNARSHRFGSVSIGGSRISARAGAASASAHASAAPANRVGVASSRASVVAGRARARVVVARRARARSIVARARRASAPSRSTWSSSSSSSSSAARRDDRRRAPGRPNVRTRPRKTVTREDARAAPSVDPAARARATPTRASAARARSGRAIDKTTTRDALDDDDRDGDDGERLIPRRFHARIVLERGRVHAHRRRVRARRGRAVARGRPLADVGVVRLDVRHRGARGAREREREEEEEEKRARRHRATASACDDRRRRAGARDGADARARAR